MSSEPRFPQDSAELLWRPERFARRLLDSAGEGIVVYDAEFRYRVWNRFMEERTGLSTGDAIGRVAFDLFPHLRSEGLVPLLERALAGEALVTPDTRYWSPYNGKSGWVVAKYEPYRDDDGRIIGVIAHVDDISERKESEVRLRLSEARFRTILENASDLVTILDRNGFAHYVSPSIEAILGIRPTEMLGRNPLERIRFDDRATVLETFRGVLAEPERPRRVQYRSLHADGTWRTLLTTVRNMIADPAVGGIVSTSRDVSEWQELQERLHQKQKIEAVGRLAGGVAHDFNNLLTVVSGNAQLLLAGSELGPEERGELEEIAHAAERAATLTRQLLAFSRQQVLQPRTLDLNGVVTPMWKLIDRLMGGAVRAECRLARPLGNVLADPAQMEQVLLNLAVNARDAMPDGGDFVVETANVWVGEAFAQRHAPMPPGDYVLLTVRDTGVGMDTSTLARAFEPFFTTKALGHGTGMGLATVYGIVKQSGGYVWVDSVLGAGTTFSIYLPKAIATRPRATATRRSDPSEARGSETILVVEDEDLVRAMTRRTLERAGYHVLEAVNGAEALTVARELGDGLDLLLTDIVMPVMGGRELASIIERELPSTRILFMSGYTDEREAIGDGGGVSRFLHKPFTLEELRSRVRALLDQSSSLA